jgi:hypothetical protein
VRGVNPNSPHEEDISMNDTTRCIPNEPAAEINDAERQPCEVWTRVMGYHRPVSSFNVGKKGEHYERRFFREAVNG